MLAAARNIPRRHRQAEGGRDSGVGPHWGQAGDSHQHRLQLQTVFTQHGGHQAERQEQERQQQLSYGSLEKPQSWASKCDDKENTAPKALPPNPASPPGSKTWSPKLSKKGSRTARSQRDAQQRRQGQTAAGGRSKKVTGLSTSKTPPLAIERRHAASNQQQHVATPRSEIGRAHV